MNLFRGLAALFTILAILTAVGGGSPVALLLLVVAAVASVFASRRPQEAPRT